MQWPMLPRWLVIVNLVGSAFAQPESPVIGLFPGTSTITAKAKNNITIAVLLPYRSFWNLSTKAEYDACAPSCVWFRQMDSGAELAVQQVNSNPNIFPDTMINILRVQMPTIPGGVAPVALEIAQNQKTVVAVVGDFADLSTAISGSVMSQYQIPMCGGTQNLPALSDRGNYPYFFRVTFSNRWGDDIAAVLKPWKVRRVAIVYDADDIESTGACLDVKRAMFSNNIIILSQRNYHGNHEDLDFSDILNEFKRVDARYVILCTQAWSNAYYLSELARKLGLMSPNHVWFSTQPPYPPDYSGSGPDPRLDNIIGMIYPLPMAVPKTDPDLIAVTSTWNELHAANPLKYQIQRFTWTNSGFYDCMGTMLYGLDQFLKKNPTYTPAMLGARQLQSQLNYTAFANTGFKGTLMNPMRIDKYGDVGAKTIFISLNQSFWEDGSQPWFGEIDKLTGIYTQFTNPPPVFFGGSSIPPADGPPMTIMTWSSNGLSSSSGQTMLALTIIGLIISVATIAFLIKYQNEKIVKMASVPECLVTLTGSLLTYTSILFYIGDVTLSHCKTRIWLLLLGYMFMIIPVVTKNARLYTILNSKKRLDGKFLTLMNRIGIAAAVLGQTGLLVYWSMRSETYLKTVIADEFMFDVCKSKDPAGELTIPLLTAFTTLVHISLPVLAFLLRNADPIYNESPALITICVAIGAIAALLQIFPANGRKTLDLMQVVLIWIGTTLVLTVLFGKKLYEVIYDRVIEKGLLRKQLKSSSATESKNGTNGSGRVDSMNEGQSSIAAAVKTTNISKSGIPGAGSIKQSSASELKVVRPIQGGKAAAPTGKKHKTCHSVQIPGIHVLKAKPSQFQLLWDPWIHGVFYFSNLHNRTWISIATLDKVYSFRIESSVQIKHTEHENGKHEVTIYEYLTKNNFKAILEFENGQSASAFVAECESRKQYMLSIE
ncbi:periplasmic binding protein-like I [Obelidium mucronatum]|nr:periplasmic binding protein-like I [Obelidium mucronatum]